MTEYKERERERERESVFEYEENYRIIELEIFPHSLNAKNTRLCSIVFHFIKIDAIINR